MDGSNRALLKERVYLRMAAVISELSTCPGGQVGAVIIRADGTVASVGVNGAPRGAPHCTEAGCSRDEAGRCRRTLHAEKNAEIWADGDLTGGAVYITRRPCSDCVAILIQRGIRKIVWAKEEDGCSPRELSPLALEFLTKAGIEYYQLEA